MTFRAERRVAGGVVDVAEIDEVEAGRDDVRASEASRRQIEHCGTPQAAPACSVEIRYIYQVLRGNPPEQVFAQTLLGFETVQADMDTGKSGGFVA